MSNLNECVDELDKVDGPYCSICGCELDWVDCGDCDGEGLVDLYEEDAILYDPGDYESCPYCHGRGGWLECPCADQHSKILEEGSGA